MTTEDIILIRHQLEDELKNALSTMEMKNTIPIIREKIKQNQAQCPHYDENYNFTYIDKCPYCGKILKKGEE